MKQEEKITLKPGLEEKYESYVSKNQDNYGHEVILVTARVCKLLDEGKTPQEAEDEGIKDSGITGFMAGAMASAIAYYHPRGEEFKVYFNKQCGGTGEEKGTINPAILTVKEK